MGYDLHITRRKDWSAEGDEISVEEWIFYVEMDPELSLWQDNGPHMARWSGKSTYADPWLDWFKGAIYSKNPDEALIYKMMEIAQFLGGCVQGDDGEIYRNKHDVKVHRNWRGNSGLFVFERLRNWLRTVLRR
jgi:hypothetical protein